MAFGAESTKKINEIVQACENAGADSVIAVWGVPGTGKTHLALAAAQQFAGHELLVRQIQFHQSYSYEDFIEGLQPTPSGGFAPRRGIFLDWNDRALRDPANRYVLLIEELSRANVSAVLGEVLTYIEYRDRIFETPVTRSRVNIAKNLVILSTMNPRDRSALELDDALIRRMRIINCPPSTTQLKEMLAESLPNGGATEPGKTIIEKLVKLFEECRRKHPETFEETMPFGHGVFAGVKNPEDLTRLWEQRIRHLLVRPNVPPDEYYVLLKSLYEWQPKPLAVAPNAPGNPAPIDPPVVPPGNAQ